jgi:hypothetical protein
MDWFILLTAWLATHFSQGLGDLSALLSAITASIGSWLTGGGTISSPMPGTGDMPGVAATPELGSFTLLGTGLLGMGSYALARLRLHRR